MFLGASSKPSLDKPEPENKFNHEARNF